MPPFLAELLQPLPLAAGAVAAALLQHAWRRYRDRLVPLNWQVVHTRIAQAGGDARFGTIQVLFNNVAVQNVFLTTVTVENASSKDLKDLDLDAFFADGTMIKGTAARVVGSANELMLSPALTERFRRAMTLKPEDANYVKEWDFLQKNRSFRVPTLNRGGSVTIPMVVEAPPGRPNPVVGMASDALGVRLQMHPPNPKLWGVNLGLAIVVGLIIGAVLAAAISYLDWSPLPISLVAFLTGATCSMLGALVVRLFRACMKLLG